MKFILLFVFPLIGFIKSENTSVVEDSQLAIPTPFPFRWPETHLKLKVVTIELMPFAHVEEDGKFQGFIPDLLQKIFGSVPNLSYEFYLVPDQKYGKKLDNGSWVGMIGEVVEKRANVAAGPLTITSGRLREVKFSFPYMPVNIVPIMKRPSKQGTKLPFRTIEEMTAVAGKGKLTYGVVKGGSTESMLNNSKYALYSGMHKQMEQMEKDGQSPFVSAYPEAIERMRNDSRYVFLGEDVTLDYLAGRKPCDLLVWGRKPLNVAFYGLAFPKDTPEVIVDYVDERIIELQRTGTMKMLKDKWWENQCDFQKPKLCLCHDPDEEEHAHRHHPHRHHSRGSNSTRNDESSEESGETLAGSIH